MVAGGGGGGRAEGEEQPEHRVRPGAGAHDPEVMTCAEMDTQAPQNSFKLISFRYLVVYSRKEGSRPVQALPL